MKEKLSKGNIHSFNDLLQLRTELDTNLHSEYSIEGMVHVHPSKEYEVKSREDLDSTISSINIFSSPYAALTGNIVLKKLIDH